MKRTPWNCLTPTGQSVVTIAMVVAAGLISYWVNL